MRKKKGIKANKRGIKEINTLLVIREAKLLFEIRPIVVLISYVGISIRDANLNNHN